MNTTAKSIGTGIKINQEHINQLYRHGEERRNKSNQRQDRIVNNRLLQELIYELSISTDLE